MPRREARSAAVPLLALRSAVATALLGWAGLGCQTTPPCDQHLPSGKAGVGHSGGSSLERAAGPRAPGPLTAGPAAEGPGQFSPRCWTSGRGSCSGPHWAWGPCPSLGRLRKFSALRTDAFEVQPPWRWVPTVRFWMPGGGGGVCGVSGVQQWRGLHRQGPACRVGVPLPARPCSGRTSLCWGVRRRPTVGQVRPCVFSEGSFGLPSSLCCTGTPQRPRSAALPACVALPVVWQWQPSGVQAAGRRFVGARGSVGS